MYRYFSSTGVPHILGMYETEPVMTYLMDLIPDVSLVCIHNINKLYRTRHKH